MSGRLSDPPAPLMPRPDVGYGITSPGPSPRRLAGAVVQGLVVMTVVHVLVAVVVPRFETVLKDFKIQLPNSTLTLLNFSRFYMKSFGWLLLAPLASLPVLVTTLSRHPTGKVLMLAYYLVLAAFVLWAALAIVETYVLLMQAISPSGGNK